MPSLVVGSSIGSLIGAAWAAGASVQKMEARARGPPARRLPGGPHRRRFPAPAGAGPLSPRAARNPGASLVGDVTFGDLTRRLLVNTADLHSGMQVMWGLPGLLGRPRSRRGGGFVRLPGIFPPGTSTGARTWTAPWWKTSGPHGRCAGRGPDPRGQRGRHQRGPLGHTRPQGFAATYIRGLEIVMQTQIETQLRDWKRAPAGAGTAPGRAHLDVRL